MLAPPASTWVPFVLRALFPEIGKSSYKSSAPVSIGFVAISIKLLPNIFLKSSLGFWAMQCLIPQCPWGKNGALWSSLHIYVQEIVNKGLSAQAIPKQDVLCFNKILFEENHSNELEWASLQHNTTTFKYQALLAHQLFIAANWTISFLGIGMPNLFYQSA